MKRAILAVGAFAVALVLALPTPGATRTWSGAWRAKVYAKVQDATGGKPLILVQKGARVTGSFSFAWASDKGAGGGFCYTGRGGVVRGAATGRTLKGVMIWPARGGHPRAKALFEATMSPRWRTFELRGEMTVGECAGFGVYLVLDWRRIR